MYVSIFQRIYYMGSIYHGLYKQSNKKKDEPLQHLSSSIKDDAIST